MLAERSLEICGVIDFGEFSNSVRFGRTLNGINIFLT